MGENDEFKNKDLIKVVKPYDEWPVSIAISNDNKDGVKHVTIKVRGTDLDETLEKANKAYDTALKE